MKKKTAIYPGSFDPITLGHFDVLKTAACIFDKVIIAVLNNTKKSCYLTIDERVKLIKETVKDLENVEVDYFEGLTVDYAQQKTQMLLFEACVLYLTLNMKCNCHKTTEP